MKIKIQCDGIACDSHLVFEVPTPGWTLRLDEADVGGHGSYVFCPSCKAQGDFFGAACPGCVEGYPDCEFFRKFAYDRSPGLTEADVRTIRAGRCPGRTNGTSFLVGRTLTPADISSLFPPEAGEAILNAVAEYRRRYMGGA